MAAGSPFLIIPNEAIILEPEYNNVVSQTESMKKEYFNVSTNGTKKYKLIFKGLSSTELNTFLTHYNDQLGGHYSFSWQTVPSYIGSGANITGRWVDKSLSMDGIGINWKASIVFEEEV